jgi:GNAT superfamily N-acetyltransferase
MGTESVTLQIREIQPPEFELIWPVFRAVVSAGDTYAYDPGMTFEAACALWTTPPCRAFAASEDGRVVGCYMLHPNQAGPGDHVANAGYMVAPEARGRGIAGRLCEHSLQVARAAGFRAMQFNAVVASNGPAVHVWQKHGFAIVGRVPQAFRHPARGLTDLLVMHRFL